MQMGMLFYALTFALIVETVHAQGSCSFISGQTSGKCEHCSEAGGGGTCRTDTSKCDWKDGKCQDSRPPAACFPGNTVVTTETGDVIKMSDVRIGDKIATLSPSGGYIFSEVRAFMHRETDIKTRYLDLETSSGKHIVLSDSHIIFMGKSNKFTDMEYKFADEVEVGDYLFHADPKNGIIPELVISKSVETMEGAYAPLTAEGTLLVNDIYASCYVAISHNIAHIAMTPMRLFPWIFDSEVELQGARPFVNFMKQLGIYVLPDQYKTQKYKSNGQIDVGVYEKPLSNWQQKCAAMKQDYNMFALHATCQK